MEMGRRLLLKILGVTPLAPLAISDLTNAPSGVNTPPLTVTGELTDTIQWGEPVHTIDDLPCVAKYGTARFVEDCEKVYVATEDGWVLFSA